MEIKENISLKKFNAFGVEAQARYFTQIEATKDIFELIQSGLLKNKPHYILGQGWNTLFTKDFEGVVIKVNLKGLTISQNENDVYINAYAGEDWIKLVDYCIDNNWQGIENLSFIPGSLGAGVFQNIAAYGQNFDETFESLEAVNLTTSIVEKFNLKDCEFTYRGSIFKKKLRNKYLILSVQLKLNKKFNINTSYHSRYGSLINELEKFASKPYTLKDISKAVINIRKTKFPDWTKVGTAGSFFLNPVITKKKLESLQKIVPNVQYYPIDNLTYPMPNDPTFVHSDYVKVAAGWLLEELGWKGKRIGNVGTSPNQALVIINYGNASAREIIDFSNKMKSDFKAKYDIELQPEVNII